MVAHDAGLYSYRVMIRHADNDDDNDHDNDHDNGHDGNGSDNGNGIGNGTATGISDRRLQPEWIALSRSIMPCRVFHAVFLGHRPHQLH